MKTLVVTGGGRGLGRVTAGKLADAGHHVAAICDRHFPDFPVDAHVISVLPLPQGFHGHRERFTGLSAW